MLRRVLPLLLGALLLVTPGSAAAEPISPRDFLDAAMVSGASGWAQTNQGLYWTEDGGATWRDFTPGGKRRRSRFAKAAHGTYKAVGTDSSPLCQPSTEKHFTLEFVPGE